MSEPHPGTPERDRVSWLQLAAYGSGGLVPIALFNIAGQLVGVLGNISLGLSAVWVGAILLVPRLWDAFSDPVMGYVTDHTRTRWGRRRPYIVLGGVLVAASFVAMWWIPSGPDIRAVFVSDGAYQAFQLAYILAGLLVFYTATTIFEIPHGALGMELSEDYHERTRLFSAKSFLGNLFAMGTPWLLWLAAREGFSGPGGTLADGMRYVSLIVAAVLVPLTFWWFTALREPAIDARPVDAPRPSFWSDMARAFANRTFLRLTAAIFALAMGFNFVANFSYYITIFYLYGGDAGPATGLLGANGTVWAVVALLAVFPLNWLSRRWGKNRTLMLAVGLMAAAQASKIVCYDPEAPYLVLIPTALLSSGMLMFFTLASSMIADVCDAEELATGVRSEGVYYSVFWWFLKLGSALASFVGGLLLAYTQFDERLSVESEALVKNIAALQAAVARAEPGSATVSERESDLASPWDAIDAQSNKLEAVLAERIADPKRDAKHLELLMIRLAELNRSASSMRESLARAAAPEQVKSDFDQLREIAQSLRQQAPRTLVRLRLVEIGLPILLSAVTVALLVGYPLTEERCYEIKAELDRRKQAPS
jgi:GPH family glycoside/pentoside/hexuronide:cation symporter